jgi:hypothetical protein
LTKWSNSSAEIWGFERNSGDRPANNSFQATAGAVALEIVTSNVWSDNVSVLLGNGDGTFAAQATRQAALPQPPAPGRSPIGQGKATLTV